VNPQRRALLGAWALGTLVGGAAIVGYSGGHLSRMTLSDGLIARYVAAHLDTPPAKISPVVTSRGTSLRYGRVGLPIVIWIASAGIPRAMPYAQPVIMALCAGAVVAAVRALFPRAPPVVLLMPFVAIGFMLAVVGGFAEALAAACGLWAVVFAERGRWWPAAGLLAVAMLARENAGAVLLGLAVAYRMWRRPRELTILCTSLVPVAGWYLFCKARFGHIPILDPYLRVTTSTIETPFVAVWHTLTKTSGDSLITAAILLGLAVAALALWRRAPLGTIAAASALQIFSAGPFSWKFIGEATRTSMFLQLFLVLTLATYVWRSELPARGSAPEAFVVAV
jgi:hypothetical protein